MVGLGLGAQTKPCVRAVVLVTLVTLVSMVYLLGSDLQTFRPVILPIFSTEDGKDNVTIISKEGYVVWSPSCQIPDMNPHHETIKKFLKPAASIICSKFDPLTYINTPEQGPPYVLKVDTRIAHLYVGKNNYTCCYSNVTRTKNDKSPDNSYKVSSCEKFTTEVTLKPQAEFILVKCHTQKIGKIEGKEVYNNMHTVLPMKEEVNSKLKIEHKEPKPSVLIIGIDSVSRLNLLRTMPQTMTFLLRDGWVELKGYNKIGDNTFPNVMAILTGRSLDHIRKCWPSKEETLDNCPYIWKNFSDQGYVTMYAEDETTMSTFNYHKKGFVHPPTDYYLRPLMLAAEKQLSLKTRDNLYICMGAKSTTEHLMKYVLEIATVFKTTPYFALLWINNLCHNNPNTLAAMDYKFLNFFHELEQIGTLNNTIVVFLSDHGMRFGKIRETVIGWYEERLPFIHIWIPKWFRRKHPDAYNNLLVNKDRLTSPYDLHLTLKDILIKNKASENKENFENQLTTNGAMSCQTCTSLFKEVMYNRSCDNAGVTPHWCSCHQYEMLSPVDNTVQEAAKFVTSKINERLLKAVNLTEKHKKCAELSLLRLVNVRGRTNKQAQHMDYVVLIETVPGNALFEATVRLHIYSHIFEVLGIISRINMYWSQSKCVNDSALKLYCFCVSS